MRALWEALKFVCFMVIMAFFAFSTFQGMVLFLDLFGGRGVLSALFALVWMFLIGWLLRTSEKFQTFAKWFLGERF